MSRPRWQLDWYRAGGGTARVRLIRLGAPGQRNRVVLRGDMTMADLSELRESLDPVFDVQLVSSFKDDRRRRGP